MKFDVLLVLAHVAAWQPAAAGDAALSPVTRIVELMKDLQAKVEADQKKETDLFTTFQCWAKTVIDAKSASNVAAKSRVEELTTYVSDLQAGRIELTTERVDLEKEVADLTNEIEAANAMRAKEHEDFLAARTEMSQAIAALKDAISVLTAATESSTGGAASSFLMVGSSESRSKSQVEQLRALMSDSNELSYAVDFGRRFLSKGDAIFLQRLLSGDVPEVDWSKLNRKADFKMSYEKRSGKIQETLSGLLATFSANLEEVEYKEQKAKDDHNLLMGSKTAMKDKAAEALQKMEAEGGARGLSLNEASAEIQALTNQISNDEGFITQTETTLSEKTSQFKVRKQVRADEAKALSEAIAILYSDDARDNFKKSFKSQGYLFLQVADSKKVTSRSEGPSAALTILRSVARKSGDRRLAALVSKVGKEGEKAAIDSVITMIDQMVTLLKDEEETDLTLKEKCEQDRMDDTRNAIVHSRDIDEDSDAISKLVSEIEELKVQIEEHQDAIKQLEEEIREATRMREDENAAWQVSDKEDTDAAATVASAADVLENLYAQGRFLQVHRDQKGKRQPLADQITAGQAPPPPPPTFTDDSSVSSTSEGNGIIAILHMLKADIEKDQAKAKSEEDAAQAAYDTFKSEAEAAIGNHNQEISTLDGEVGSRESSIATLQGEQTTSKGELVAVMNKIKDVESDCDFITIHFPTRVANRQMEIDGLEKAKHILSAADVTQ